LFYQRHKESSLSEVAADKTNNTPQGFHLSFAGCLPKGSPKVIPKNATNSPPPDSYRDPLCSAKRGVLDLVKYDNSWVKSVNKESEY